MVYPAKRGLSLIYFENLSCQEILIQVFLSFSKWLSWFKKSSVVNVDYFKNVLWRLQIDQKTNKIFVRISTLAYKKMSSQKSGVRESK